MDSAGLILLSKLFPLLLVSVWLWMGMAEGWVMTLLVSVFLICDPWEP